MNRAAASDRPHEALLWLALAAGFSPVIAGIAAAADEAGFQWSVLLAPLLVTRLACAARPAPPHRRAGAAAIAAGTLLQVFGVLVGSLSIARLGLPVAALGLGLWLGRPRPRDAVLLFAAVPVPFFLYDLTTPHLEVQWARIAQVVTGGVVEARGPVLFAGGARLELHPWDSGLHLGLVLAEVAWYRGALLGAGWVGRGARAALALLAAVPVQIAVVCATAGLLAAGRQEAAQAWLSLGSWLLLAAAPLIHAEWRARTTGARGDA